MKRENKKLAPTIPTSIPNYSNKIDEISSIEPDASMLIEIPYSLDELIAIVNLLWNLVLCILLGLSLMLIRINLGHEGNTANWDHLIGSLVITVTVCATAEVARPCAGLFLLIFSNEWAGR